MPSNGERKPETKDKPHPIEKPPKQVNPTTMGGLGKTAVNGTQKDKK